MLLKTGKIASFGAAFGMPSLSLTAPTPAAAQLGNGPACSRYCHDLYPDPTQDVLETVCFNNCLETHGPPPPPVITRGHTMDFIKL